MGIRDIKLKDRIRLAKFPFGKRQLAFDIAWEGVKNFREYQSPKYYSHTGKAIKKPSIFHKPSRGRYNQKDARTILISALARAWQLGFNKNPTLNHQKDADSPFAIFAIPILGYEGIGKPHQHLEEYWAIRKYEWLNKKRRLFGGS